MSLQWHFVAAFLYLEIATIILLMIPFISVTIWQKIFTAKFLKNLAAYANMYIVVSFIFLLFLFLESIRQMQKHSELREQEKDHMLTELQQSMKLFRSQRNFYISGFALFLILVIRRLVSLISKQAILQMTLETTFKQAIAAKDVVNRLMKEKEDDETSRERKKNIEEAQYQEKMRELQGKLENSRNELTSTKMDFEVLKKCAEATNDEYDQLLEKHHKLQEELQASDNSESKKDG